MQHLIATYGYVAIFVLMVAESACLPVPSELIMTFGGALAAGAVPGTSLNLIGVIAAGVAGNVVGSYIAWAVGWYGGQPALRRWGHRLVRPVWPTSGPDRPSAAGRADLHLAARRNRRNEAGPVRDLHDHRLHPVDRSAGLRWLRGRLQLAIHRQRLPRPHLHHRGAGGDRPRHRDLVVRPAAPGRSPRGRPAARRGRPAARRGRPAARRQGPPVMHDATAGTAASHHDDPGRAATDAEPVRRAAVVMHPAKHDDIDGFRATVSKAMADRGWAEPLWLETRPDDTGERLAREAVRSGADLVLASGGDGTIT